MTTSDNQRDANGIKLLQMADGAWVAKAIYVAAKLGIADLLANGPCSIEDLAAETKTNTDALYRTLRALASSGVFAELEHRRFILTPLAEPLRTDHPDSVRAFAIMTNEELYEAFCELSYSVETGKPGFDKRFGMSVWDYYASHPEVDATFVRGMNDWHRWNATAVAETYDFSKVKKVCDVGGGNGLFLSKLLHKFPHLSGVLLDRHAGIEAARREAGGALPRCELVVGDFLKEVPPECDLYTIKYVINDWTDEDAVKILSACRRAMGKDGRVLVLESLIAPGNDQAFTKWLDLLMMAVTGGRERSRADFERLFEEAGLSLTRVIQTPGDTISIVEGRKQGA